MTSKGASLKKQRCIDGTEMEEEEGKRLKGVVGCRIYKEEEGCGVLRPQIDCELRVSQERSFPVLPPQPAFLSS